MTARSLLTTELQTQNRYFLNTAANYHLTPVRYFLGGKTVVILGETAESTDSPSNPSWIKTALMIIAFIPGLIIGAVARYFSFNIEEVRAGFALLIKPPSPPIIPETPVDASLSQAIHFLIELQDVSDDNLADWLKERKPLDEAAALVKSKQPEDVDLEILGLILSLYSEATERIKRLGLDHLFDPPPSAEPPKTPLMRPITPGLLQQMRNFKDLMTPEEFERHCRKNRLDHTEVIARLKEVVPIRQPSLKKDRSAADRAVRVRLALADATVFFNNILRIQIDKLPRWLEAIAKSKTYRYPLFFCREMNGKRKAFEEYIEASQITKLLELYERVCVLLKTLKLERYINEEAPPLPK